jgi:ATP-binding cassette, subfamily B, bacterial CvaB/MchF/RaxB
LSQSLLLVKAYEARSIMDVLYQSESSECGLVCLAMVAGAHGLQHDLASLRSRYAVSIKGATLKTLMSVANDLKLETRALRCELNDLSEIRLPAILHWRNSHFVVLAKVRRGRFVIHDPAAGKLTLRAKDVSDHFTGVVLETWPGPKFQRQDMRNRLKIDTIFPRTGEVSAALWMLFALAFGVEIAALAMPMLQQLIIDNALVTADLNLLQLLAVGMAIMLFGQAATTAIRGLVLRNLTAFTSLIVPVHIFQHLAALPPTWFERRSAADIVSRFDSGKAIQQTLTTTVVGAGIDGVVALVALAAMAMYEPFLTALVLVATLTYGAIRILYYNTFRQASAGIIAQSAKVEGILWETLRGMSTIKAFNAEQQRRGTYLSALSHAVQLQNSVSTVTTAFGFAHEMLFAAERVLILYLGALAVLDNRLSVGMLIAFLSFRENFVGKASSLIEAVFQFRMLSIHTDRLADILLTERERNTPMPFLGDRSIEGRVEVRNASFRYGAGEPDVLTNCSLSVAPGEIVAIIGPSGAGKSTLFKLLSGQLTPRAGDILIDGLPIATFGIERLRDLIAIVRQDDMLFAGTISENVSFIHDTPNQERIQECASKAQIHDEIQRMPMGYNTLVGSMGTGLSGGQSQRLMLARALYRQPRLLLLDEATSHLDLDNERGISLTLRDLGVTQIVIAHRPETIAKADRVIDIRQINHRRAESHPQTATLSPFPPAQ